MTERGKVVDIKGKKAIVRMERRASCKDCNMCGFGANDKFVDLVADNDKNAQIGDTVELTFSTNMVVKAMGVIYVLPIILAGLSLVITTTLKLSEWLQLGIALGSLLTCVMFVYLAEKFFRKKKYSPVIINVIKENAIEEF